jgi:serine/threonine protein kinase
MTPQAITSSPFPDEGEIFAERYRVEALVGVGGFSRVYRAEQIGLERPVAVKVLAPASANSSTPTEVIEQRFYREARLLSQLRGPHVVLLHDYGRTASGLLFMVSEFIDGRDLKETLAEEGMLDEARARDIFTQVLYGLSEAHAAGFLHRDVKPSNIMLFRGHDGSEQVKLLDFGIAKGIAGMSEETTPLTRTGAVIGTPRYMSPEQMIGQALAPTSDLHSAALVAYEMLVGRSPFEGLQFKAIQQRAGSASVRLPATLDIADDFRRILEKLLAVSPSTRFQSCTEVLRALDEPVDAVTREWSKSSARPRHAKVVTFPLQFDSAGQTTLNTLTTPATSDISVTDESSTTDDTPDVPSTPGEADAAGSAAPVSESHPSQGVQSDDDTASAGHRRAWPWALWVVGAVVVGAAGFFILSESTSGEGASQSAGEASSSVGAAIRGASTAVDRSARSAAIEARIAGRQLELDALPETADDGDMEFDSTDVVHENDSPQ